MTEFQEIYDSEINFSISTFWDAGWQIKLGDELNGFVAETTVETFDQILPWLQKSIKIHFPKSYYASLLSSTSQSNSSLLQI